MALLLAPPRHPVVPSRLAGSWVRIEAGELVTARTEGEFAPDGGYALSTLVVGPSGSLFSFEEGEFELASGDLRLHPRSLQSSRWQQDNPSGRLAALRPGPPRRYRCRLLPSGTLRLVDENGIATEWERA